jgi:hypothetical protein
VEGEVAWLRSAREGNSSNEHNRQQAKLYFLPPGLLPNGQRHKKKGNSAKVTLITLLFNGKGKVYLKKKILN